MAIPFSRALLRAGVLVAFIAPSAAFAQTPSVSVAAAAAMKPGTFAWDESAEGAGPVSIVVSLPDQRAYVYQKAVLVAVTTVSTGKEGHETPVGEFTILQKEVDHHSNKYDDAPMPYMQRLTWDGVAIHAGAVRSSPASHGCVRVPLAFAKKLYGLTKLGAKVEITDMPIAPAAMPADPVETLPAPEPAVDQTPVAAPIMASAPVPAPTDAMPASDAADGSVVVASR